MSKDVEIPYEVLNELNGQHPVVDWILEYRELAKLRGTYCLALPLALDPVDRRLHCTFNQVNTVTGRLSTTNPNLQSVPIVSAWGRRVRQAFVGADADHVIISADYSQVELRILAHIADEPALIAAFERGEDIHARTAAEVFGIPLEAVSKEQRGHAKRINFGIAYGMGAFALSGCSYLFSTILGASSTNFCSASATSKSDTARPTSDPTRYNPPSDPKS